MNRTEKLKWLEATLIVLMVSPVGCLPNLDPIANEDVGADVSDGRGDGGSTDTATDARVDAGCPDIPVECTDGNSSNLCAPDGSRFECVTDDDGCVFLRNVGACSQGEFCEEGECVACPETPGCSEDNGLVCNASGHVARCVLDEDGCFALEKDEECEFGSYCQDGICEPCRDLGAACDEADTRRCAEGSDDPSPPTQTVERCVMSNGCMVYQADEVLECDTGSICAAGGMCESCHDPECSDPEVTDGDALACLTEEPGSIKRCVANVFGCLEATVEPCMVETYCAETGALADPAVCQSCADLASSCEIEGALRCNAGSTAREVCRTDPATRCLVWSVESTCADEGVNGGVCVPSGQIIDPELMTTANEAQCVPNECDTLNATSCSAEGDVETCTVDQNTGVHYLRLTQDCSERQSCAGAGVKSCVCNHECDPGDDECFEDANTQGHFVTQVCGTSPTDGCRIFVPDNSNVCNDSNIPTTGGVACDMNLGDDSVFRCVVEGDMCRRARSQQCPCTGTIVCNRSQCAEDGVFGNGNLKYKCE